MSRYVLRRLGAAAVTLWLTTLAVFLIVQAVPGDIVAQMLGQAVAGGGASEQALRHFFGLDQPLYTQYLGWLVGVVKGDFGQSWTQGAPVLALVADAFLVTLELGLLTLIVATLVGVPLGLIAGRYRGRWPDRLVQAVNLLGLSAPVFWVGLMLLVGASVANGWGPPVFYLSPAESLADNLAIMALPVASLGVLQAAAYAQFVRENAVAIAGEDFVRTARAKGLREGRVFGRHVLRNLMIPLVTFMGLSRVQILGGVVVIDSVFALPGLGRLLLSALQARDYPVVQGGLLFIAAVTILVNFAIDLLYRWIDPRLRRSP